MSNPHDAPRAAARLDGVLLVDKAGGLTSHDLVARARRLLRTRAIGHAGTLDPMATGLMVLLVGEATKLSPFLSADRKRYEAEVCLGLTTDSLDADGQPGDPVDVPADLRDELTRASAAIADLARASASLSDQARASTSLSDLVRASLSSAALARASVPLVDLAPRLARALDHERARSEQVPPSVSALHVDGERAHERVRRGETLDLPPRPVHVHSLDLLAVDASGERPRVRVVLDVDKGYYVRAFARDLGASLGLPAHLTSLRRLASGPFTIDDAAPLAADQPLPPWLSLADAARRALPVATLSVDGVLRARQGKRLAAADFTGEPPPALAAWLDEVGHLVAVGAPDDDPAIETPGWRVRRGFAAPPSVAASGTSG